MGHPAATGRRHRPRSGKPRRKQINKNPDGSKNPGKTIKRYVLYTQQLHEADPADNNTIGSPQARVEIEPWRQKQTKKQRAPTLKAMW